MDAEPHKDIPGFSIIEPRYLGLLDQHRVMGWKFFTEIGNYGMAYRLSSENPELVNEWREKFWRIGYKLNRKFTSKERHLWFAVWRLKGNVSKLETQMKYMKSIPSRLNWLQKLAWIIVYKEKHDGC